MKTSFLILNILLYAGVVPLCAARDFYADYIEKNPIPVVLPVSDEADSAALAWQTRFADACAIIMDRREKTQIEARKILYSLLDERPDSKEVLDLLDFVLKINPPAKEEVAKNILRLAEKHGSSIPLNMFVTDWIPPGEWTAGFLKNALILYTQDPRTVAALPGGTEHVRDLIVVTCVFSAEYHKPELVALMYRCYKAYPWFKNEKIENLRVPLSVLHSVVSYPSFCFTQGKPEVLALYRDLRNLYLESICGDGLETLAPDDEKLPCFQLCAQLLPPPHTAFIAELEKSLKARSGNIAKTELLAFFYILNNRKADASVLLQNFLKNADKKEKDMILLVSSILSETGRWSELLAFSEKYFQYLPEKTAVRVRLDMVKDLVEKKDYLRAAEVLKHLKSFQSLSGRIQLLMMAQRFDEAYKLLKERALPRYAAGERTVDPRQEETFIQTASALAEMYNDLATAEKLYLLWLKDHPEDPFFLNNLAYTYAVQNIKLDDALRMSTAALKADPGNAAFLDTMAWILYQQKKYRDAAVSIEKAIAASGKDEEVIVEVLEHAGDIYSALGDELRAKLYWLRALKILKDTELRANVKNGSEEKRIREKLDKLKENTEK